MNLNDLLQNQGIDPRKVLVLRHRPYEPEFRKVLPWLAAERPDAFNAYQQTQVPKLECAMRDLVGSGFVASFIGHKPSKALFVGLYSISGAKPLTYEEYWSVPAYVEMKQLGMMGWSRENDERKIQLWFDLLLANFCATWKGKLVIGWPPPERSWWRRAHRNEIPVTAILEESALCPTMPEWTAIELTWRELAVLPTRWRDALSQWRGIYFIWDDSDGKGYVGSAHGESNLLGRWLDYSIRGHGGNSLLRQRDPQHFHFTILQRVSPDLDADEVIRLEGSWKKRLHTNAPQGLNEN
jgi:hypothetical protein